MITEEKRQIRNLRKHLTELVKANRSALDAFDKVMKWPDSNKRGQAIAKICNHIELNTDLAGRYGLGEKFKGEK